MWKIGSAWIRTSCGGEAPRLDQRLGVRTKIRVGQHRTLRAPGRAGRVEDRCKVVRAARNVVPRVRLRRRRDRRRSPEPSAASVSTCATPRGSEARPSASRRAGSATKTVGRASPTKYATSDGRVGGVERQEDCARPAARRGRGRAPPATSPPAPPPGRRALRQAPQAPTPPAPKGGRRRRRRKPPASPGVVMKVRSGGVARQQAGDEMVRHCPGILARAAAEFRAPRGAQNGPVNARAFPVDRPASSSRPSPSRAGEAWPAGHAFPGKGGFHDRARFLESRRSCSDAAFQRRRPGAGIRAIRSRSRSTTGPASSSAPTSWARC